MSSEFYEPHVGDKMPKYIFKKLRDTDNRFDTSSIEMVVETECLDELREQFDLFLHACGYVWTDEEERTKPPNCS